jgi:fluoride exporter
LNFLLVAIGGGLGACLRYACSLWLQTLNQTWPWSTLLVNASGGLLAGVFLSMQINSNVSSSMRLLVLVGLLGGFTTFSAFNLEFMQLVLQHRFIAALTSVLLNVAISLGLCAFGFWLTQKLIVPA